MESEDTNGISKWFSLNSKPSTIHTLLKMGSRTQGHYLETMIFDLKKTPIFTQILNGFRLRNYSNSADPEQEMEYAKRGRNNNNNQQPTSPKKNKNAAQNKTKQNCASLFLNTKGKWSMSSICVRGRSWGSAEQVAQTVDCLPCKHKDLSPILWTEAQKPGMTILGLDR